MINNVMNEIDLPDHTKELNSAETLLNKYKIRYKKIIERNIKDLNDLEAMYDKTLELLEYIGQLSIPSFNASEKLEENHFKIYKDSPELAKTLWLEKYKELHHPYNLLKNRCFNMLDDLERDINQQRRKKGLPRM